MRTHLRAPAPSYRIDGFKLRLKIGARECQADGPVDVVAAHLETWKTLAGFAPPTRRSPRRGAAGDRAARKRTRGRLITVAIR